jgi:hypothetical protein
MHTAIFLMNPCECILIFRAEDEVLRHQYLLNYLGDILRTYMPISEILTSTRLAATEKCDVSYTDDTLCTLFL